MPSQAKTISSDAVTAIQNELGRATAATKCHPCGCFHSTVEALSKSDLEPLFRQDIERARDVYSEKKYDCLGCAECYPAIAANVVADLLGGSSGLDVCATDLPKERSGWPPLPGDYRVMRYRAPVAVCTLNNSDLMHDLTALPNDAVAIVGTMRTENLGIERVVKNVIANENIRFLLVCGDDTRQIIGHLPGQSLESLFREGIDERLRITGAKGKRPVLKNVTRQEISAFVNQVQFVSMIGVSDVAIINEKINHLKAVRVPPLSDSRLTTNSVTVTRAAAPERMTSDPGGFFVIYPERSGRITVEHYTNDGVLNHIVEGRSPGALYTTIIDLKLITRLDHAAYLGRELARAVASIETGQQYVQDRAPEQDSTESASPEGCCSSSSCSSPQER